MILAKQLGMIPSWQFQPNTVNMNPHVQFPPGWNQLTTQPVGPNYAPPPEAGLGRSWFARRAGGCVCDSGREWCCTSRTGMRGLGISELWTSRLIVGGALLAGVAAIAGVMLAAK